MICLEHRLCRKSTPRTPKIFSLLGKDAGCTKKELESEVEAESEVMEVVDQKGGHSLVMWDFGEGREELFVQPTTESQQVLVVGWSISWWGLARFKNS